MLPHPFPHHSALGLNSNVSSSRTTSLIFWTRQPLRDIFPQCFASLHGNLPTCDGFFKVGSPLCTLRPARAGPNPSPSPPQCQHPGLWLQRQHIPVFEAEPTAIISFSSSRTTRQLCTKLLLHLFEPAYPAIHKGAYMGVIFRTLVT